MKLNIKDFKFNPDQETFFELNGFETNNTTTLTCDSQSITCRMDTFGSKILKVVPLKAVTGILLQYQRDTKFLAACCCFGATALALLVAGLCVTSSTGLYIMSGVSLFLGLICFLVFLSSKTIIFAVRNGAHDYAIKIAVKPNSTAHRNHFEEVVMTLQKRI